MIRLFAAIAVPDEIAAGLARRQTGLKGARWRTAEQLHLTLRFFGEVREDVARDLDSELAGISGAPFEMVLEGAGAFDDGRDIHAVWAGVAETPELKRLAKACESAARRAGLKAEVRHFRPHVTLAYLRHAEPDKVAAWIQANNLLKSPPIRVTGFGLYSSVLGGEGSHYQLEAEYEF
jgi:2'-5' RNA ligase